MSFPDRSNRSNFGSGWRSPSGIAHLAADEQDVDAFEIAVHPRACTSNPGRKQSCLLYFGTLLSRRIEPAVPSLLPVPVRPRVLRGLVLVLIMSPGRFKQRPVSLAPGGGPAARAAGGDRRVGLRILFELFLHA